MAPLKVDLGARREQGLVKYPWLKGHGSIEAGAR